MNYKYTIKILLLFIIPVIISIYLGGCSSGSKGNENIKPLLGRWEGFLQFPNKNFLLVADISLDKENNIKVKLSSPQQKAFSVLVDSLEFNKSKISFKVSNVKAAYEGEFKIDSSEIVGTWRQEKFNVPLIFYREGELGRLNRPQYPFRPYSYNSDSVTFKNKRDNVVLGGTFTYPKSDGLFPTILLINGMGPQDRDESMYGHKPFLIISDYLTKKGFAVLRVDDRGTGLSTGDFDHSTTMDFANDAQSAINYLKTKDNVDTSKIGIIGFNEGGLIAAMLSVKSDDIKYIVLLATPGIPGREILLDQTTIMQKKLGIPEEEITKDLRLNTSIFNTIEHENDTSLVRKKLKKIYKSFIASLGEKYAFSKKYNVRNIDKQINFMTKPWFRFYLTYDPAKTFEKVKCPLLILYGEKDLQIEPEKNNAAIEKALQKGGNQSFKSMILPDLNHLFQECKTGSPSEYPEIKQTFSPKAMQIIADWIKGVIESNNNKVAFK